MCKQIRTVAVISETLAQELGVEFKDLEGNFIISLQLAEELEPGEFNLLAANFEGILPLNPKKPILRPRP